jgi:hypothetical protein
VNSVTWTQLLASNEVQRHKTSKKELDKLRAVIARDFADASLDGVSAGSGGRTRRLLPHHLAHLLFHLFAVGSALCVPTIHV